MSSAMSSAMSSLKERCEKLELLVTKLVEQNKVTAEIDMVTYTRFKIFQADSKADRLEISRLTARVEQLEQLEKK